MSNVFVEARYGVGDNLARMFLRPHQSLPLARMVHGFYSGKIDRIGVWGTRFRPDLLEVYDAMGIQHRTDVEGWTPATELTEPAEIEPLTCPTVQPRFSFPRKYVLFSQFAGAEERCLDHHDLYRTVKSATKLPIIKVGKTFEIHQNEKEVECDLDFTDKTTLPETLFMCANATAIIAPCSWYRCCSSLFRVPVIELVQEGRVKPETMERTNLEYKEGQYGIHSWNRWLEIPREYDELVHLIKKCESRNPEHSFTLWPEAVV